MVPYYIIAYYRQHLGFANISLPTFVTVNRFQTSSNFGYGIFFKHSQQLSIIRTYVEPVDNFTQSYVSRNPTNFFYLFSSIFLGTYVRLHILSTNESKRRESILHALSPCEQKIGKNNFSKGSCKILVRYQREYQYRTVPYVSNHSWAVSFLVTFF